MKNKKIPVRMCVGCHNKVTRDKLIRITRVSSAELMINNNSLFTGRSFYLCPLKDCLKQSFKGKKLALKMKLASKNNLSAIKENLIGSI